MAEARNGASSVLGRVSVVVLVAASAIGCEMPLREDDVGDAEACEEVEAWPEAWAELEDRLFDAFARTRAVGASCDGRTPVSVPAVERVAELRCAARLHAQDRSDAGRLSHLGLDGSSTVDRVFRAEYPGLPVHELMAADFEEPFDVIDAWLDSPQHCAAVLDPSISHVGVGHAERRTTPQSAWVLLTGREHE